VPNIGEELRLGREKKKLKSPSFKRTCKDMLFALATFKAVGK